MGFTLNDMKTADKKKFLKIRTRLKHCLKWIETNGDKNKDSKKYLAGWELNLFRMTAFLKKHSGFEHLAWSFAIAGQKYTEAT